jgi:hypothetical protein
MLFFFYLRLKCHIRSVLLKVAMDKDMNGIYLYGGKKPNMEIAMKTFSHEVRAASHYFNELQQIQGTIIPAFQTIVDHKGIFKTLYSILPLNCV